MENGFSIEAKGDYEDLVWQDGTEVSNYRVTEAGIYTAIASNEICTVTDTITIAEKSCLKTFYAPTVFMPNATVQNPENRVFKIQFPETPSSFECRIFDRWGSLLAYFNDYNQTWDGTYKGEYVPTGTYVYQIQYAFEDRRVIQKVGTVTVVR